MINHIIYEHPEIDENFEGLDHEVKRPIRANFVRATRKSQTSIRFYHIFCIETNAWILPIKRRFKFNASIVNKRII